MGKAVKQTAPPHRARKVARDRKHFTQLVSSVGAKLKKKQGEPVLQKPVKHADPYKVPNRIRAVTMVVDAGKSQAEVVRYFKTEGIKLSKRTLVRWVKKYREGDRAMEDKHRSGAPVTVTTPTNLKKWATKLYRARGKGSRGIARSSKCHHSTVIAALPSRWSD